MTPTPQQIQAAFDWWNSAENIVSDPPHFDTILALLQPASDEGMVRVPVTLVSAAQNVCQAFTGSEDQRLKIERLREEGRRWNNTNDIRREPLTAADAGEVK